MQLHLFLELQNKQLVKVQNLQKRYLYDSIDWQGRLNIIVGMRGTGKTTLMLQNIQNNFSHNQEALYITGDHTLTHQFGLFEIAWEFEKQGGKHLSIDEVHKYPNWQQELKNIYDSFPGLTLVVSGSSSVDIIKGQYDLSRRASLHTLRGLSFREYLNFTLPENTFTPVPLSDILQRTHQISTEITRIIESHSLKVLPLFQKYFQFGYYPYFLEGEDDYLLKLNNALSKVLYEDIPAVFHVKAQSIHIMQKLLYFIATSHPFILNISGIASDFGIAKETVYAYLDYLRKAGLIRFVNRSHKGARLARKPEKIYLENSNLFYAVGYENNLTANTGAMRESYVSNQLTSCHALQTAKKGDFLVDNTYIFEIGGKRKSRKQIHDLQEAYLIKDNIETGSHGVIPLWLLGFLY